MIVSLHNHLPGVTQREVPATALDYATDSLWSGPIARAWRSAGAATAFNFRFRLTANRPVGMVALFDVRASGFARVTSIEVRHHNTWPFLFGTPAGSIALSERGDGALYLPVPIAADSWQLSVTLSSPGLLTVGGMWMGEAYEYPAPSSLTVGRAGNAIDNISAAATRTRTRIASPTRAVSLEWPSLEDDEAADLARLIDEANASSEPVVLVPRVSDRSDVYRGFLSPEAEATAEPGVLWDGYGLTLHEDGRSLGV